jgi:hypothetical protein
MTDLDERFEARFERRLRAFADVPVDAVDADEVARRVVRPPRIPSDVRIALLAAALFIAFVIAALVLAGGSKPPILAALPTPTVVQPTGTVARLLDEGLDGTWVADVPTGMSFPGAGGARRMNLVLDTRSQYAFVRADGSRLERFAASTERPADGSIRFVARGASDGVEIAASPLPGCAAPDAGDYRMERSPDGSRLTLTPGDDVCPARAAVLGRTWIRLLSEPNHGGAGVVDAFDPLFSVELPQGVYTIDRTTDAMEIHDQVQDQGFLMFKDPQGFLDPCDVSRGRYDIAPGAQPWVDYFAQLRGFTTDSVTDLLVDGHKAKSLVVHIDPAESCPQGFLSEWQPKKQTSDQHWLLRPGDTDYMVVVELADTTLLFQVLPTPDALGGQVIGSIRFLEALPSTP